tara:strand:- start:420 stop:581 length:162 start_codon:yes stop_codon:yes gene_type:complete
MKYLTVLALVGLAQSHKLGFRPATTHQDVVNDEQIQADEDFQTGEGSLHQSQA